MIFQKEADMKKYICALVLVLLCLSLGFYFLPFTFFTVSEPGDLSDQNALNQAPRRSHFNPDSPCSSLDYTSRFEPVFYAEQGGMDFERAQASFQKAYEEQKQISGEAGLWPEGCNLAFTLAGLRQWPAFEKLLEEIYQDWESRPPHEHTAMAIRRYTGLIYELGQYGQWDLTARLLGRLKSLAALKLPPNHPYRLDLERMALKVEADQLLNDGQEAEALAVLGRLYESLDKQDERHQLYLLELVIQPYYLAGRQDEADKMLAEIRKAQQEHYQPDMPTGNLSLRIVAATLPFRAAAAGYSPGEPLSVHDEARLRSLIGQLVKLEDELGEIDPKLTQQASALLLLRGYTGLIHLFLGDWENGEQNLRDFLKRLNEVQCQKLKDGLTSCFIIDASRQSRVLGEFLDVDLDHLIFFQALGGLTELRALSRGHLLLENGRYDDARRHFAKARASIVKAMGAPAVKRRNKEAGRIFLDGRIPDETAARYYSQTSHLGRLMLICDYYTALAEYELNNLDEAETLAQATARAMEGLEVCRFDLIKVRRLLGMIADRRTGKTLEGVADS